MLNRQMNARLIRHVIARGYKVRFSACLIYLSHLNIDKKSHRFGERIGVCEWLSFIAEGT